MPDTLAWHFTGAKLRDGRPIPPIGEVLRVRKPLKICYVGLHGSERLIDALQYAPGLMLHRTRHGGEILRQEDKLCSEERTILWSIDATDLLRSFARQCAMNVAHLWDMPTVVRQYLATGDETIRDAANTAAWAAARAAASAAASSAARAAASAAASSAAWDAASAAARDAAWDAVSAATRADASAAWAAASSAASAAARSAAWAAAVAAQNDRLTTMIMHAGCPV